MKTTCQDQAQDRQGYEPPAIVYEAALEVRAGSPLTIPMDSLDLLGGGQGK